MSEITFKLPPMVAKMQATGKVIQPSGKVVEITLTAEQPITLQENESGNHPLKRGLDRSD